MSSCLQVNISVTPPQLKAEVSKVSNNLPLPSIAEVGEHLRVACRDMVSTHLTPVIAEVGSHLKVSCGMICSIADILYLEVLPEEVRWITPDEAIIYEVMANVEWTVEND